MKTVTCDKCGKEIDNNSPSISVYGVNREYPHQPNIWDLCKECCIPIRDMVAGIIEDKPVVVDTELLDKQISEM